MLLTGFTVRRQHLILTGKGRVFVVSETPRLNKSETDNVYEFEISNFNLKSDNYIFLKIIMK